MFEKLKQTAQDLFGNDEVERILALPITQVRLDLKQAFNAKTFSEEDFEKIVERLRPLDRTLDAQLDIVRKAMAERAVDDALDIVLDTPAKTALWAAAFMRMMEEGQAPLVKSTIWSQMKDSIGFFNEGTRVARVISASLQNNEVTFDWGQPGSWFYYDPHENHINLDMFMTLMMGFEHMRVVHMHEIGHSELSNEFPPRMQELYARIKTIIDPRRLTDDEKAQKSKKPQATPQEQLQMLADVNEWQLRFMLWHMVEDNCVNQFAVNMEKVLPIQNFAASWNHVGVTLQGYGEIARGDADKSLEDVTSDMPRARTLREKAEQIMEKMQEADRKRQREAYLQMVNNPLSDKDVAAIKAGKISPQLAQRMFHMNKTVVWLSFYERTGLFRDNDKGWAKFKVFKDDINRTVDVSNIPDAAGMSAFDYLYQLSIGAKGISNQQPRVSDRMFGRDHYRTKVEETTQARNALMEKIWDLYLKPYADVLIAQNQQDMQNRQQQKQQNGQGQQQQQQQGQQQGQQQQSQGGQGQQQQDKNDSGQGDKSQSPQGGTSKPGDDAQGAGGQDKDEQKDDKKPEKSDAKPSGEDKDEKQDNKPEGDDAPKSSGQDQDDQQDQSEGQDSEQNKDQDRQSEDQQEQDDKTSNSDKQQQQKEDLDEDLAERMKDMAETPQDKKEQEHQAEQDNARAKAEAQKNKEDAQQEGQPENQPSADKPGWQQDPDAEADPKKAGDMKDKAPVSEGMTDEQKERLREAMKGMASGGASAGSSMGATSASDIDLSKLAKGDWRDFEKRAMELAPVVNQIARSFEQIREKQKRDIIRQSRTDHEFMAQDGDFQERFDRDKRLERVFKMQSGQKLEVDDFKSFRDDVIKTMASSIEMTFMIDGSASMPDMRLSGGITAMEAALQSAVIMYLAARKVGIDAYIIMWGNTEPLVVATPESNLREVGKKLEGLRNGIHSGTDLSPALQTTIGTMAEYKPAGDVISGSSHIFVYSDGDIGDPLPAKADLLKVARHGRNVSVDVAVFRPNVNDSRTKMEGIFDAAIKESGSRNIGTLRGDDPNEMPRELARTVLRRVNAIQIKSEPDVIKRRHLKSLHNKMTS